VPFGFTSDLGLILRARHWCAAGELAGPVVSKWPTMCASLFAALVHGQSKGCKEEEQEETVCLEWQQEKGFICLCSVLANLG